MGLAVVRGRGVFLYLSTYELRRTWVAIAASLLYALFVAVWVGVINKRSGGGTAGAPAPSSPAALRRKRERRRLGVGEFAFLRERLDVSDSDLSKQIPHLTGARSLRYTTAAATAHTKPSTTVTLRA